jgi:hypothetical protein
LTLVWSFLAKYVKFERHRLFLRFSTLALSVPSAMLFLISLGFFFLGYPFQIKVGLVPVTAMGVWFSVLFSNMAVNLFNRLFFLKLSQGTVLATGDERAMDIIVRAAAERQLLPSKCGWHWILFSDWPGTEELIALNAKSKRLYEERPAVKKSAPGNAKSQNQAVHENDPSWFVSSERGTEAQTGKTDGESPGEDDGFGQGPRIIH